MSYCRASDDSDCYVYGSSTSLVCSSCDLYKNPWWRHVQQFIVNWIDGWITVLDGVLRILTLGIWYSSFSFNWVVYRTKQKWGTFKRSFRTNSRQEMIDHLRDHRKAGHRVPQRAIDRLYEEIWSRGDRF